MFQTGALYIIKRAVPLLLGYKWIRYANRDEASQKSTIKSTSNQKSLKSLFILQNFAMKNAQNVEKYIKDKVSKSKQIQILEKQAQSLKIKQLQGANLKLSQQNRIKYNNEKILIQSNKLQNRINLGFKWLPHLLLAFISLKILKNIKNPKMFPKIFLYFYFWTISYPWAYMSYSALVKFYVVPKIMVKVKTNITSSIQKQALKQVAFIEQMV